MRLIRTALVAALVACPSLAAAQSFTGTITGTIRDTSGAAYKSTMKMTSSGRGRSVNMTMSVTGKYLGPACGDVK